MNEDYLVKEESYRGCTIKVYYDESPESPREWDNIATFVCEHPRYNLGDEQDVEKAVDSLFDEHVYSEAIIKYFCKTRHCKFRPADEEDRENGWAGEYEYKVEVSENWRAYDDGKRSIGLEAREDKYEILAYKMAEELDTGEKMELIDKSGEVAMLPISMYDHSGITVWLGSTEGHFDARWDCSSLGFAYIEKEKAMEFGSHKEGDDWKSWAYNAMRLEMKVYDDYCRGEVYGFLIEDEYGNEDTEDLEGGCGYYGESGIEQLLDEAKGQIDSHLRWKEAHKQENIHKIYNNLAQLRNKQFIIYGMAYKVGKDMSGADDLQRAKITDDVVGEYGEVSITGLDELTLGSLASHVKVAETAAT